MAAKPAFDLTLYLVVGGDALGGRPLDEVVAAAVRGGVTLVQLREKTRPDAEIVERARALKDLLGPLDVPLIVNDRVEVARAAGADGVHLGQDDLDAALEEAQAAAGVSRGDLWALGDHRLLCGDATDQGDVARLLGAQRAAMAFTDPPYNVGLGDHGGQQRGASRRRIKNDALPPEEWEAFCRAWTKNLLDSVDGALYVCMSTKEWPLVSRVLAEAGGHWSDTIIWAKDRFVLGRADYQRQYEPIWFGWRQGAQHHWCGDRDQGDVWTIPRPTDSELHPTMKPLALVERALRNSTRAGDSVLDPFLGSGTTLIACERSGRICYGMELEPHYVDVAIKRWESFTGEQAKKETR